MLSKVTARIPAETIKTALEIAKDRSPGAAINARDLGNHHIPDTSRGFHLRLARDQKWSSREVERQLAGALFERTILSPAKLSPAVTELHLDVAAVFEDTYLVEFLDLPPEHTEPDLQRALIEQLKPLGKKS